MYGGDGSIPLDGLPAGSLDSWVAGLPAGLLDGRPGGLRGNLADGVLDGLLDIHSQVTLL